MPSSHLLLLQTLAVAQRLLLEQWRQKRGLIFWAVFPSTMMLLSVLIIVIWVCLGLVALTVYFADQMTVEMRAADGQVAEVVARQAAAGGARYAAFVLGQFGTGGAVPYRDDYRSAEVALGDATFWLLGRDPDQRPTDEPVFGLVDEASKLNLNTAASDIAVA